jgi:hypothetical protein
MARRTTFSLRWLALAGLLVSCAPAPAPACAEAVIPDCSGTPVLDFATLESTVLRPSCVVMTACHSTLEHEGDLILDDPSIAYDQFSRFVTPGDAHCSVVGERLTTTNVTRRMPPAGGLSDERRCAILAWIEAGASP